MAVMLEINVWTVSPSSKTGLVSFEVDVSLKTTRVQSKKTVGEQLGWIPSNFRLYKPSHAIRLPEEITDEVYEAYAWRPLDFLASNVASNEASNAVSNAFGLREVPSKWNDRDELADQSAIHLVAFGRGDFKVNVYDSKSRKVDKIAVGVDQMIGTFCKHAHKPPTLINCGTPAKRRAARVALEKLDLSKLEEVGPSLTLLHLYPLGLPRGVVHFVDTPPTDEDEEERRDIVTPLSGPLSVTAQRESFFKSNRRSAPSTEAKGHNSATRPNRELVGLWDSYLDPAPPHLFDETLCKLHHDVRHGQYTPADYEAYKKLRDAMREDYPVESDRKFKFHEISSDFLPAKPRGIAIGGYQTDGALDVEYNKEHYMYVIAEAKNFVSATGEPDVQASRCYLEHCRCLNIEDVSGDLEHCVLPAILLCIRGHQLSVFAASSGGHNPRPAAELVAHLDFQHDLRTAEVAAEGARVIGAIRVGSEALRVKYPDLLRDCRYQVRFPYPRSFVENGERVWFTYTRGEEDKMLYYAECDDTKAPICVKFTARYSSSAHETASNANYAPKLLACETVGQWQMVVMADESEKYMTLEDYKIEVRDRPASMIQMIRDETKKALEILHGKNFVHGDVRAPNVLVLRKAGDEMGPGSVLLVDWEWAGEEGEVYYPLDINRELARHPEAKAGGAIKRVHDIWMLGQF